MKNEVPQGIAILGATLLSKSEAENLLSPHELDCFWLRDMDKHGNAYYAANCSISSMCPDGGIALVRPALKIKIQDSTISIGDTFDVGPFEFKILSEDTAWMHIHNLGPMKFQSRKATFVNYEHSDVKCVVDNFYKRYCGRNNAAKYLTVKELIEKLKQFPEDAPVMVQYRDDGGCYQGADTEFELYQLPQSVDGIPKGTVLL